MGSVSGNYDGAGSLETGQASERRVVKCQLMNDLRGNSVVLKEAGRQELDFILYAEQSAKTDGFVGGWSEAEHRSAMQDADVAYWLILAQPDARPVGYVIVRGLGS